MRKLLVALLVCGTAALVASPAIAAPCGVPIFMQHQVSNFVCADATEVAALAWQINNPANHSGTENIACEEVGVNGCNQGGVAGDGVVVIDFDWANPGIAGCPQVGTTNNRVVVLVQADDGRGVLASIGGTSVDLTAGYIVDLAHPGGAGGDPTAPQPLPCGSAAGRPHVNSATNNADSTTTLDLTFPAAAINTDCDPNSVGQAFGFCGDSFVPSVQYGNIYTSIQRCNKTCSLTPTTTCTSNRECAGAGNECKVPTKPTIDRSIWTVNTVRPNATTGSAVITVPRPTSTGDCLFVGASTIVNGTESSAVTGFTSVGGPGAASPVALDVRAERAAANVKIRWRTTVEIGLAGFNILADGGKQGVRKVNDAMIAANGNGGGKGYEASIPRGKFQNSHTVIIESVLTDGTTLRSAPAQF